MVAARTLAGMSSYDTVHTGHRCGRSKAFGLLGADLAPGDPCRAYPAPTDDAALAAHLAGTRSPHPQISFQVAMWQGGFVIVEAGHLTGWQDTAHPDLPCFDSLGAPMPEPVDLGTPLSSPILARLRHRAESAHPTEGPAEAVLNDILGRPHLPFLTGAQLEDRREQLRAQARAELDTALGRPGDCPLCAALRAGTLTEYRRTHPAPVPSVRPSGSRRGPHVGPR